MSPIRPPLRIDVEQQPDACVIRIAGELDRPRCSELEFALADAERSQAPRIVVDLDRLSSIDARGLETLLLASRRSASNGKRLRLTGGTGEVARVFRLMMLDVTLPFTESVGSRESTADAESGRGRVSRARESLSARFLRLQEEAKVARRLFQLYKARTYGPRFTDPVLLFQLERGFLMAENRLRRANPAAPRGPHTLG